MNMRSYKIDELSTVLKLISDLSRLHILSILIGGEQCVCELMEKVKLSQSLISHHLQDLKKHDLVRGRKDGKWSYYSLTPKGIDITNLIFKIKL
jgi:ArsR family transcriptional regulator, arsenate/arsenite/antimonite-responsive transcriptional repressor